MRGIADMGSRVASILMVAMTGAIVLGVLTSHVCAALMAQLAR
jgi:hypothetical protein